jgi:signal transduction histidine kinase
MRSVRARITALATAASAVVLVLAAVVLVTALDQQLTSQGDGAAKARAEDIARDAVRGHVDREIQPATDDGLVQVVDQSGAVLGASRNVRGDAAIAAPSRTADGPRVQTITAPDDNETERYRVWTVAVATDRGVLTVFAGTSLETVSEATRTLRGAMFAGVPMMLLLVAAGTWLVVGRALSRVERVRREVDEIGDDDIARRLEPGTADEVGRLIATLNALLERLDGARREQRDFVADASHELQSPITAFRAQLEVARTHPDRADWKALVDDLLEDTTRMEVLVRDLLVLAAGESPEPSARTLVDLADVVTEAVASVDASGRTVTVHASDGVVVRGDPAPLTRTVRNLVDNAVRHAASEVEVAVRREGGGAVVRVADDGPGVAPDQVDSIFRRFHRGDASRSRADTGTGLGLAIARTLARRYGGDVVLEADGPGAVFTLRLPVPSAGLAPDEDARQGRRPLV